MTRAIYSFLVLLDLYELMKCLKGNWLIFSSFQFLASYTSTLVPKKRVSKQKQHVFNWHVARQYFMLAGAGYILCCWLHGNVLQILYIFFFVLIVFMSNCNAVYENYQLAIANCPSKNFNWHMGFSSQGGLKNWIKVGKK